MFSKSSQHFIFFVILISILQSCNQPAQEEKAASAIFNRDSLAQHIIMLASDSFQGRKPFTLGETRTLAYLENQFRSIGLEPGNGISYLQDVPMVEITPHPDSVMKVESAKGSFVLHNAKDYVITTENTDSAISLNKNELIFAGYGVVAPEYNWNDYAGINVKGKVVLVMVNDPGFGTADTSIFKGRTMTYYGRWTYKYEEAARQGAKACLIIHNTEAASYPFSVIQHSWGSSNLYLDKRGSNQLSLRITGMGKRRCGKKITSCGRERYGTPGAGQQSWLQSDFIA